MDDVFYMEGEHNLDTLPRPLIKSAGLSKSTTQTTEFGTWEAYFFYNAQDTKSFPVCEA